MYNLLCEKHPYSVVKKLINIPAFLLVKSSSLASIAPYTSYCLLIETRAVSQICSLVGSANTSSVFQA
jgi:hypothetical protein